MVVPNCFVFSMERREKVCEDKVEDDSAVDKDYRWESDNVAIEICMFMCVGVCDFFVLFLDSEDIDFVLYS